MKAKDITVGAVLLWNGNKDWQIGWGQERKATVINAEVANWYQDSAKGEWKKAAKATSSYRMHTTHGVLVKVQAWSHSANAFIERTEVAPIAQLRGEWEATKALVAATAAERARMQDAERARRAAADERASVARQRAIVAGARPWVDVTQKSDGTLVVSAAFLAALLDAAGSDFTYDPSK